jgi:predicted transporter
MITASMNFIRVIDILSVIIILQIKVGVSAGLGILPKADHLPMDYPSCIPGQYIFYRLCQAVA